VRRAAGGVSSKQIIATTGHQRCPINDAPRARQFAASTRGARIVSSHQQSVMCARKLRVYTFAEIMRCRDGLNTRFGDAVAREMPELR
jgi:hypothetical protein